jgi:hypothetical protein
MSFPSGKFERLDNLRRFSSHFCVEKMLNVPQNLELLKIQVKEAAVKTMNCWIW